MRDLVEELSKGPVGETGKEIESGECATSLAVKNAMTGERLWQHPSNKKLRETRRHPNILLPGDKIFIPNKEPAQREKRVNKQYTFRRKELSCELQLRFTAFGEPRAEEDFQVFSGKVDLGRGKLDKSGMLKVKIPVEAADAITVLIGRRKEKFEFKPGSLPPATEPRGIQARLWNLGYYCGDISDTFTAETEAAFRRFLWKNKKIDPEGQSLDKDTVEKGLAFLVTAHGS